MKPVGTRTGTASSKRFPSPHGEVVLELCGFSEDMHGEQLFPSPYGEVVDAKYLETKAFATFGLIQLSRY